MCQKEINALRPAYNAVCSTGQRISEECRGSLGNQAARELDKVTRRWVMITNRVTTNQQQLELALKDWQEYTSLTENLMVWLREKEKILRAQSKATTVRELERELDAMKVALLLHCALTLVSYVVVIWVVTQNGEERCVTTRVTAAQETIYPVASSSLFIKGNHLCKVIFRSL